MRPRRRGLCWPDNSREDSNAILSGYFEGNARSANVLRKLGFMETARDTKYCRALGIDRPHITMRVTLAAFKNSAHSGGA